VLIVFQVELVWLTTKSAKLQDHFSSALRALRVLRGESLFFKVRLLDHGTCDGFLPYSLIGARLSIETVGGSSKFFSLPALSATW